MQIKLMEESAPLSPSFDICPFHKPRALWIIDIVYNRSVPDPLYGFINDKQRHHELFPWHYRPTETITDFDVKPSRLEDAVDQIFQL